MSNDTIFVAWISSDYFESLLYSLRLCCEEKTTWSNRINFRLPFLGGFENPRRGRQAKNFTTNVPKISLDPKGCSWLNLYWFKLEVNICAPVCCQLFYVVSQVCKKLSSLISVFAAYSIRLIIYFLCFQW